MLRETSRRGEHDPDVSAFVVADADWLSDQHLDNAPIISESGFFRQYSREPVRMFLAFGMPDIKRRVFSSLRAKVVGSFPNLIHPKSTMDDKSGKVTLGEGNIVYPGVSLTTEIGIGSFVHINPGVTVGHECRIGDFTTLCPGAHISGRVVLGEGCFIGAGAVIKEGLNIASNCLIGAGAVVIKSTTESGVWAGVPARKLMP